MGDCKQSMTPAKNKASGNLADLVASCDAELMRLIDIKNKELHDEAGREKYNARQLARLYAMASMMESVNNLMGDYKNDR